METNDEVFFCPLPVLLLSLLLLLLLSHCKMAPNWQLSLPAADWLHHGPKKGSGREQGAGVEVAVKLTHPEPA